MNTSLLQDFLGHKMLLEADTDVLIRCKWTDTSDIPAPKPDHGVINMAVSQISEYLAGERREFSIPLRLEGTAFRKKVWSELRAIPYGEAITYKELASRIGNPKAVRAVANACGANPFPILIPCHRVVASGGKAGGYTGGLDIKLALLEIEKQNRRQ
ncbi:MAG: methylated-DNA--[protein]-cysteine S-methyltransferase [Muribaculaceae bacterium]|nr:methylated-DNA--[protein]-cysteine S-methyltransferase [Muribaculaceae bacterium]